MPILILVLSLCILYLVYTKWPKKDKCKHVDWTKWETEKINAHNRQGYIEFQSRTCNDCGKKETRNVGGIDD